MRRSDLHEVDVLSAYEMRRKPVARSSRFARHYHPFLQREIQMSVENIAMLLLCEVFLCFTPSSRDVRFLRAEDNYCLPHMTVQT